MVEERIIKMAKMLNAKALQQAREDTKSEGQRFPWQWEHALNFVKHVEKEWALSQEEKIELLHHLTAAIRMS